MSDLGNTTRTVGWTAKLCKKIVPEVMARLLAYRYLLSVLKREGYYNYTPEALKQDEEKWENEKGTYINLSTTKAEWILNHYGSDYTDNESVYLQDDDNGRHIVNPMTYASLMLKNVSTGFDIKTDNSKILAM